MIRLHTFAIILLMCGVNAQAQDTAYVEQFEKLRNIQLNTWITDVDFSISPQYVEGLNKVTLTPNVRSQVGISTGFKWFTLTLGVQLPETELNPKQYGHTSYIDFYFGGYKNHIGGEIYYRNFQGLYRQSVGEIRGKSLPDAALTNLGLTFLYVFNNRFSMRSAISQQELQKRSAGSVIIFTNYNHRAMKANGSIIPADIDTRELFSDMQGLTQIRFHTINVRPGYAHNFVIKKGKYFFSPSGFIGFGVANYSFNGLSGTHQGVNLDVDGHMKLSAGYNHKQVFFNVFWVVDQNYTALIGNSSALQSRSYGFNLGYRLHSFFHVKWL